jgi:hypothetical protein
LTGLVVTQTFQISSAQIRFMVVSGTVPFTPDQSQEAVGEGNSITYNADTESFTLSVGQGVLPVGATFAPSNIVTTPSTQLTVYNNGSVAFLMLKPGDAGLGYQYLTYGEWTINGVPGQGFMVFGIDTPEASIPHGGTASFLGKTGAVLISSGKQYGLGGDVALTADFAAGTVNGAFTNMRKHDLATDVDTPWFDMTISTALTGSTFAGTLRNGDASVSGKISGGLYGPASQEIGGTWAASGPLDNAAGVFIGKRQ